MGKYIYSDVIDSLLNPNNKLDQYMIDYKEFFEELNVYVKNSGVKKGINVAYATGGIYDICPCVAAKTILEELNVEVRTLETLLSNACPSVSLQFAQKYSELVSCEERHHGSGVSRIAKAYDQQGLEKFYLEKAFLRNNQKATQQTNVHNKYINNINNSINISNSPISNSAIGNNIEYQNNVGLVEQIQGMLNDEIKKQVSSELAELKNTGNKKPLVDKLITLLGTGADVVTIITPILSLLNS